LATTSKNTDEPKRRRVGRPAGISPNIQRAVLAAARDELMEFGYSDFRVERVAERADVHRSTLYRHWPTPAALARDAIVTWQVASVPVPRDSGNWRTDLRALCTGFRNTLGTPEAVTLMRTLVIANAVDPELRDALMERWVQPELVEVIVRAQHRGEVPADLDPGHLFELIAAPFVLRAVVTMMPMDDEFVESVAARIAASVE
jgi:AcrR family transcriptional regulator